MNDRFTAQLRQHLVDTANERPADGTIAAIAARVAVTDQRIPLVARWTMRPGRIGAFPTPALRFVLLAVALGLAIGAAALIAGGERPRSTLFEGGWTSLDPADGSTQLLVVAAGDSPSVRFQDQYASGEACVAATSRVFTADGTGTVVGDRLFVEFPEGGGCGQLVAGVGPWGYTHDETTDAIVDDLGLRWQRIDRDAPPPSPAPSVPPTPEPTPEPTPDDAALVCVDLTDGGRYTALVGPLSVTATVPDDASLPWQGSPDWFYLRSGCTYGVVAISIFVSTATETGRIACIPRSSTDVTSFTDAVDRLSTPKGDDIVGPIDLTIGGHTAVRFDITDLSTCDGFGLWSGTIIGEGESGSVYVIDVDGEIVAIEVNRHRDAPPNLVDEAAVIVESLEFDGPGIDPATPGVAPSEEPTSAAPAPSAEPASEAPSAEVPAPPAEPTSAAPASADPASGDPAASSSPEPAAP